MKDIANLPIWFNKEEVIDYLNRGYLLSQDNLKVLVDFYCNYQYRGDGYWEAFVSINDNVKCKIRYSRIEGEIIYEQPEVM